MGIFDIFRKSNKEINHVKKIDNYTNNKSKKKLIYFENVYKKCLYKYGLNLEELSQFYDSNACINCGCVLSNEIKGTRNCPECKSKIIVKTDMYSKKKILLSQDMLKSYEKYDKEVREILFMERLMNKKISIYNNYMNKFNELKQNEISNARDIMYQFSNYVGTQLDNKAYKEYMYASRLKPQDRVLSSFDAILDFRKANQEYITLYSICMFEEKYNVAISLLTDIIYRDIQITALDIESNPYHKATNEDFKNNIHINQIKELIAKTNYSFEDFKKIFIEQRHPFILPKISNNDSWKFVQIAMR